MGEVQTSLSERTAIFQRESPVTSTDMSAQAAFWLRPGDKLDRAILHLMRSHIVAAETRYPGAGEIAFRVACETVSHFSSQTGLGRRLGDITDLIDTATEILSKELTPRRRMRFEDAVHLTGRIPAEVREEMRDLLPSLSLGTSISVKKWRGKETRIDRTAGGRVKVSPPKVPGMVRTVRQPKAVIFDGVIESVSQLHSLLTDAAESGTHYLIVCREAADEVERTLAVNCMRGTVSVMIVYSRLDDLTVGSIDDISAYLGVKKVDYQSGETIAMRIIRSDRTVGVVCLEGYTLCLLSSPSSDMAAHSRSLHEDLGSTREEAVRDFLAARLLGLSSDRLTIHVGEDAVRRDPTLVEKIDSDLRSLVSCVSRGVSDSFSLPQGFPEEISQITRRSMREAPAVSGSAHAGMIAGLRFARDLCTIGAAVV